MATTDIMEIDAMERDYMTRKDVAQYLKCSLSTVSKIKKKIGCMQDGRLLRFDRRKVEEYCERRERAPDEREEQAWASQCVTEKRVRSGSSLRTVTASDIRQRLTAKKRQSSSQHV